MTRQTIEHGPEHGPGGRKAKQAKAAKRTGDKDTAGRVGQNRVGQNRAGQNRQTDGRGADNTKAHQLVALFPRKGVSRKGGARLSLICERLGWQAHTVRAAISRLRKQGFEIATSKAAKSRKVGDTPKSSGAGETVYAINASSGVKDTSSNGASR